MSPAFFSTHMWKCRWGTFGEMRMGQCSWGVLQSALNAVRLFADGAELHFPQVCTCSGLFNTSVEMPVRNSPRGANEPVFMGLFPICTYAGATLESPSLRKFGNKALQSLLLGG